MTSNMRLSYSAIICFLNNQIQFKKRYIAKVYDDPASPALVVGRAIHKMIEERLNGTTVEDAITAGLAEIENVADYEIDYGKTGSREKMLNDYQRLSVAVINELPVYENIVGVEDKIEADLVIHNKKIPFKAYLDLVRDLGDSIEIVDFKSVTSYSDEDSENYKYLLQAWLYTQLAEFKYKKPVSRFVFSEIKKTINRDGSPQIKNYVLDRQAIADANDLLGRVVKKVSDYVDNPNSEYFPNPSDLMNGANSMEIMAQIEGTSVRTVHAVEQREKFAPVNTVVAEDIVKDSGTDNERIMAKLAEFGIGGKIEDCIESHSVKTYLLRPNRGVKMSKIAGLEDDLALALGSDAVRIIAPIYGTQTVGIEVPKEQTFPTCEEMPRGSIIPIGVDTQNNVVYDDIAKMPHMLIGGQTGSGKSVFIRNIIMSLQDCDIVVLDCKMIDYADLRSEHCRILTEREDAIKAINDLVRLMELRYRAMYPEKTRRKVLIIDEYADLVMGLGKEKRKDDEGKTYTVDTRKEMETSLCRLLQKARAANINVIIATQRPSADIVAPIIKANCPVKACLRVATAKNSEIILDEAGGERLVGKGDMLYLGSGKIKPVRVQCFAPMERRS